MQQMMGDCCGFGMGSWWGGLLWVVFLALIVVGAIVLIRALWGSDSGERRGGRDPALGVLEERFARGEIDRDEFEERRRTLTS